jgi:2,3-bisphosphoglycerate-dependent phosphoglycerate mutase
MYKKLIIICLTITCLSHFSALAQQTVVWIVRHAEKQTADGTMSSTDLALTADGDKRAQDLATALKGQKITAVYSTPYKRTTATAAPLASQLNLKIATYDARSGTQVAGKVLQENKGKEVLIVGHSNTLIPLAKALGAAVPFETLTDDDYDMLLKVTVDDKGQAKLTISHYGQKHHTTEVPAAYKM